MQHQNFLATGNRVVIRVKQERIINVINPLRIYTEIKYHRRGIEGINKKIHEKKTVTNDKTRSAELGERGVEKKRLTKPRPTSRKELEQKGICNGKGFKEKGTEKKGGCVNAVKKKEGAVTGCFQNKYVEAVTNRTGQRRVGVRGGTKGDHRTNSITEWDWVTKVPNFL